MENELDLQELQEKPRPKRLPAKKPSGFDAPKPAAEPVKKVEAPKPAAPTPPAPVVAEAPKPEPKKAVAPKPEPKKVEAPKPEPAPAPVARRKERVARPRRKGDGESNRGMRIRY